MLKSMPAWKKYDTAGSDGSDQNELSLLFNAYVKVAEDS